ncbi:MAG TPA: copper homeostasis membrane protein CopD [Xanthobacteraceae bacterium]|nr:copper homeostasis membrane protein CopD [Xanthobacteraceae bacterium]
MDDSLILVRAVHFVSTLLVSGVVLFLIFVAEPAFRKSGGDTHLPTIVRRRLAYSAWIGLTFVLISGAAWLLIATARMNDIPFAEVFSNAAVWTVLTQTDFGYDWVTRLFLAILLAAALLPVHSTRGIASKWKGLIAVSFAAGLVATLAWAGHAAAGTGFARTFHLIADGLHLIAAAAWIGALVPLAGLLAAAEHRVEESSITIAREAVLRFSTLGIVSVVTLMTTGIINTLMLVGSVTVLIGTDYGRLLLAKVVLFLVMLAIASVNRLLLTPHIIRAQSSEPLRQLRINSLIEATIGALILIIVSVLGTLPPGIQEQTAG